MENRILYGHKTQPKLLENFNFKYIKNFDTFKIKNEILLFDKEWNEDSSRQEKYAAHSKTFSYFCYDYSEFSQQDEAYTLQTKTTNDKILELVEPIIKDLEEIHKGKRGKVLFIKLPSRCEVNIHRDRGYYLGIIRRHHIPIITNNECVFEVNCDMLNMLEGECWEINNSKYHYVNNNGETDRVHLMIDIIPDKFIK